MVLEERELRESLVPLVVNGFGVAEERELERLSEVGEGAC